jgi:hypothetical protein
MKKKGSILVITLAKSNQCGDDMIPRGVTVIKGLVTEPVGQAVDTESGLLDEEADLGQYGPITVLVIWTTYILRIPA